MKTIIRDFLGLLAIAVIATACGGTESADAPPKSAAMQSDADGMPAAAPVAAPSAAPAEAAEAAAAEKSVSPAGVTCNRDLDETECLRIGGDFGPHGKMQMRYCICPTSDSGKVCTDNSGCEGYCECNTQDDREGRCSARVTGFGCVCKMRDGRPLRICKD